MTAAPVLLAGCAWVVVCDDAATVLRDHDVLLLDGAIAALAPAPRDPTAPSPVRERAVALGAPNIDARRRLVMPGLVNLHTHTPMTLLRGLAEDVDLQGFLERVWAAEGAVMDAPTVELGARLGALEALRGGTTCAADMYFHHRSAHVGAVAVGLRHVGGPTFFDMPGPDGLSWDRRLADLARWPGELAEIGGPETPQCVAPHSTYLVSPAHLRDLADVVRGWRRPLLHTHVSENLAENAQVKHQQGRTPTRVLSDAGVLDGSFPVVFGHGVHLDPNDVAVAVAAGATVAHCPGSNLKLASGALPWAAYREAGLRRGIGTDGCSSSNDLDMWVAMRLAALLARLTAGRPDAAAAAEIVRAVTLDGARGLGMGDLIGSVEAGKRADLVLLDLDAPHLTPVHDPHALLVYAAGRGDVVDVFVDGERVVADRRSTRLDEADLLARCRERGATAAEAAAGAQAVRADAGVQAVRADGSASAAPLAGSGSMAPPAEDAAP